MRTTSRFVAAFVALAVLGVLAWLMLGASRDQVDASPARPQATVGGKSLAISVDQDAAKSSAAQRAPVADATIGASTGDAQPASTWKARFVAAAGGSALPDLPVELAFFSREGPSNTWRGRSDASGAIGPLDVDLVRAPAANLIVRASPRAAGLRAQIEFSDGQHEQVFTLSAPHRLTARVGDSSGSVAGARVWIDSSPAMVVREAQTDNAGIAEFAWDFPDDDCVVRASATGRVAVASCRVATPLARDVDLRLFLASTASLEVIVLDVADRPLPGACLRLRSEALVHSQNSSSTDNRAAWPISDSFDGRTDATGRATLDGIPSGVALGIELGCAGEIDARFTVEALGAGESRSVVLRMPAKSGVLVLVEDAQGKPVDGATVGVGAERVGSSGASGAFTIPYGDEAAAVVWVERTGFAIAWKESIDLSSTAATPAVRFVLESEAAISGIVVDADDKPVRFTRVSWLPKLVNASPLRRELGQLAVERQMTATGPTPRSGSDGRFRVGGLPPGRHDLLVAPAKGATFEILAVPGGTEDLRIVLPRDSIDDSSTGPVFDIAVLDALSGAPIANADVNVWKLDAGQDGSTAQKSSHDSRRRKADARGIARIAWPAPGWYAISASAAGHCDAMTEYKRYEAGSWSEAINLTPASKLEVRVVDASGKPLAGAWVSIVDAAGSAIDLKVSTSDGHISGECLPADARGSLPFQTVPAGRVVARVCRDPSAKDVLVAQEVTLRAGELRTLELRVDRP